MEGTAKTYVIGYIAAIILTLLSFSLVLFSQLDRFWIITGILALGFIQIIVHLLCFLHMYKKSEQYWNWWALFYTIMILCILVGASIWIMYQLNLNMVNMGSSP